MADWFDKNWKINVVSPDGTVISKDLSYDELTMPVTACKVTPVKNESLPRGFGTRITADYIYVYDSQDSSAMHYPVAKKQAQFLASHGLIQWKSDDNRWIFTNKEVIKQYLDGEIARTMKINFDKKKKANLTEETAVSPEVLASVEQTNEYVDLINTKKYQPLMHFQAVDEFIAETYDIVVGEKFDVMTKRFHEGAQFTLVKVNYDVLKEKRTFTFKRSEKFVDLEDSFAREHLKDFNKIDEWVAESKVEREKRKIQNERRKQKRAEEAEVNRIVIETHKEEGGFGAWS